MGGTLFLSKILKAYKVFSAATKLHKVLLSALKEDFKSKRFEGLVDFAVLLR